MGNLSIRFLWHGFRVQERLRLLVLFAWMPAYALGQAIQAQNASTVLAQMSQAVSSGRVIQNVKMSGSATWYVGDSEDSGTVDLSASNTGVSQMTLSLATNGQRTETQNGAGPTAICQWAGKDGVVHAVDRNNCWKANLWFYPALSLQVSALPNYLGVADLGTDPVGSSAENYRHIQSQLVFADIPLGITTDVMRQSAADLGLDPISFLPAILAYAVRPDSGAEISIPMEVHYSDYRTVNGVQVPFLIQRYVNGTLQLEIHLSSAEIN
jgi:hypothetical protein